TWSISFELISKCGELCVPRHLTAQVSGHRFVRLSHLIFSGLGSRYSADRWRIVVTRDFSQRRFAELRIHLSLNRFLSVSLSPSKSRESLLCSASALPSCFLQNAHPTNRYPPEYVR